MKKSLMKNSLRTISKTKRRFLSILIMALLGVGFFSGLVATSPDMLDSLDKYADSSNMYDINIISSAGLTDEDIDAVEEISGVDGAYGIKTKDSKVKVDEEESICKVIEYNENINTPVLISGRMPETADECLLDLEYLESDNYEDYIGKIITLQNEDKNVNGEDIFTEKEFKVVGIVESPIYISSERGTTTIGNGKISFYIYCQSDVINLDYYTEIGVIVSGAKELVTNSDEYLEIVNSVYEKIEEIKETREQARYDEIYQMQTVKWYIQDRTDNTGYTNIFDAIETMSNISKMFPAIFYIVAVLISLTSMTRMIDEERGEIGTLKALGYTSFQIMSKYILYAFLACVIGGIIGMSISFYLFPYIVWSLYATIYTIPKFYATYRLSIGLAGILIAFICIGGATISVAHKKLKETPAILMRPKPPKNGKRIFMERITIIWKHLNFSQKVTARNIFRYKKRAMITIIGIAGCTGLMLAGFGIKDSVSDIPTYQFENIFKYEASVTLSNTEGIDEINEYLSNNQNVEDSHEINASTGKIANDTTSYDVNIFVPNESENFDKVCNLMDSETGEILQLSNDGAVITDKLAETFEIQVGDEITLIDGDDNEYILKVDGIAENNVSHYIYMAKEYYEANIGSYETNMILINLEDIDEEEQNTILEELLNCKGVASASNISTMVESVSDALNIMNSVVIVLIVTSAMLEFVVLYNLANINIGERQREIATLKVLGFYDKEVDNYINKENIIFTIIGIALGLIVGVLLTNGIITSIEIDSLKFARRIFTSSYIISAITTMVFSIIVNKIIHFVLKKIDMIESLKSVE